LSVKTKAENVVGFWLLDFNWLPGLTGDTKIQQRHPERLPDTAFAFTDNRQPTTDNR